MRGKFLACDVLPPRLPRRHAYDCRRCFGLACYADNDCFPRRLRCASGLLANLCFFEADAEITDLRQIFITHTY